MAGNALPLLLLGGAAVMMMGGKKSKKGALPPAPTQAAGINEQKFVEIVLANRPKYHWLGSPGIEQKVDGIDSEGFVYPVANETLATWYTRVAYYGAYPYAPHVIPPQCIAPSLAETLGVPCPPEMLPHRDAMMRIFAMVSKGLRAEGADPNAKVS